MRYQRWCKLTAIVLFFFCGKSATAQPVFPNGASVCARLHAKAMPNDFDVDVMAFTGPSGDGRRGSAGFVLQTRDFIGDGTSAWHFVFQRDASGFGFQVVHPFQDGQVVVSVIGSTVSIKRTIGSIIT